MEDTFTLSKGFIGLGNNIIMFPEGSRGEPGVLQRFRKGTVKFSIGLDIPILPAVIVGTEKAWPKGESFMRPANITIKILPPIISKDKSTLTEKAYNKELSTQTKKLEKMIIKALKEFENK